MSGVESSDFSSAFSVEKCLSLTSGVKNLDLPAFSVEKCPSSTSGVENLDFSSASLLVDVGGRELGRRALDRRQEKILMS
jgi:hypothetical protein